MADTVVTRYLFDGVRRKVLNCNCISDGTGETGVVKAAIANLRFGPANALIPTYTTVDYVQYSIQGFTSIRLYWDHAADDPIAICPTGFGYFDFSGIGGKVDPKSAGGLGDILLTSAGATSGATYDITIYFRPKVD